MDDYRADLVRVAKDALDHTQAGTLRLAPGVMDLPASVYTDERYFRDEMRQVFRRIPLMLAAGCEIARPGDYKTMDIAGVPILLIRGRDGAARAFLNVCTHRAATLAHGCGNAARLTCPYHGWTFNDRGKLVGIASRSDFGEVEMETKGLREFPLLETAGLIWVVLDPDSRLDIRAFLCGYDRLLGAFGLENWHFVDRRIVQGEQCNWKLAFDAHMEFYHVPVLHKNSFGANTCNKALYYFWGPHQRLVSPCTNSRPNADAAKAIRPDGKPDSAKFLKLLEKPEAEWPTEAMLVGEWIIFPNVSINSFYEGGRGVIISQIFPGKAPGESYTVLTYLAASEPDERWRAKADGLCALLDKVVGTEDLHTSHGQQHAIASGLVETVSFGRNEGGLQDYHRWMARIMKAGDAELNGLFAKGHGIRAA